MYSTPNSRYLWNSVPLPTCFTFPVWNASLFHSFYKFLILATFPLFYMEHFTTTAKVLANFAILSSSYIQDCFMPCLYFCINHIFIHIFKHNFATIILTSERFSSWQYKVASYGYLKLLFRQMGKTWTWTHYSIPQILCSLLDCFIKSNFDNSWLELYLFFDDLCFFFTFLALLFPCL